MAVIKSGFNITVTCSQNSAIKFCCKSKKRPGIRLKDKLDLTTDQTTGGCEFAPSPLKEITDGQLVVPDDPTLETQIIAILGKTGTITFTVNHGTGTTAETVVFSNAWFASYTPGDADISSGVPTATIVIQGSSGSIASSSSNSNSSGN